MSEISCRIMEDSQIWLNPYCAIAIEKEPPFFFFYIYIYIYIWPYKKEISIATGHQIWAKKNVKLWLA